MKDIIGKNVTCKQEADKLKLIIYYRGITTRTLVMKNNQNKPPSKLQKCNVIYEYKCNIDGCEHRPNCSYIGYTTTTLSRRLTMHLGSGGPKTHCHDDHNQLTLTRAMLEENTEILRHEQNDQRLRILESLIIQAKNPTINRQSTGQLRTLKLFSLPIVPATIPA